MNFGVQCVVVAFGLVTGSFLTLCAYRLPRGMSVVRPGSRCPQCQHPLGAGDNLPVAGYLLLRGRCRYCRRSIAPRYLLLELGTGLAFLWSWERRGPGWGFVQGAFFLACLLLLAATDLESRQLPDEVTLAGWLVGLIFAARLSPGPGPALLTSGIASGGLALVALVFLRVRGREGMGWGDIKMVGLLGAFLGARGTIVAVFVGSVSAALAGIVQSAAVFLGRRRRGRSWTQARRATALFMGRAALPFGVFLAAGAVIAWAWTPQLWRAWLGM
ncbi:MAG TPA: prepilin peptidase [Terriglobales bacterium]|nr:prepilin peptidase [Terriglobales bacterium]